MTCFVCGGSTAHPLSLWGRPVCRPCAARIGIQRDYLGAARDLEKVPPLMDELDVTLAIWIAQAMLEE